MKLDHKVSRTVTRFLIPVGLLAVSTVGVSPQASSVATQVVHRPPLVISSSGFYGAGAQNNPTQNVAPVPNFEPTTYGFSTPPCYQSGQAALVQCNQLALEAINNAHQIEGVAPISLPSDYATLPNDIQQFIIVNLERVSFGLPPITGITASLNAVAQGGVVAHTDPWSTDPTLVYASNWFGGSRALVGDYMYMYQDGWDGPNSTMNFDCTSPNAPGCWGHRDNILWNPGTPLSFGAAEGPWINGYNNSALIIAQTVPAHGYIYTWAQYLQSANSQVQSSTPQGQCSSSVGTAVGAAADPSGGGWVVGSSGIVATQGNAPCYGSLAGQTLNAPIVGIAATPDGKGYWLVASDGGIFTFGDAAYYGSMGGTPLNKPIVGIAATPDGKGYWLVASDGGIFSFNAPFFGSMGGTHLNKPIVGMDALNNGQGYRFVAADGGIFDFGAAGFLGSMGGQSLSAPIVGMAATGNGYWLVGGAGAVYSY